MCFDDNGQYFLDAVPSGTVTTVILQAADESYWKIDVNTDRELVSDPSGPPAPAVVLGGGGGPMHHHPALMHVPHGRPWSEIQVLEAQMLFEAEKLKPAAIAKGRVYGVQAPQQEYFSARFTVDDSSEEALLLLLAN